MTGRVVAAAVVAVVLAGCGGSSSGGQAPATVPSHAPSPAPRLSLSAFDAARLGFACDDVRIARRAIGRDPEASIEKDLSGAASGFAKIAAPAAQQYAGALRAAANAPMGSRAQVIAGTLAVCRANGA